jgi:Uma2 family endonuclease
VARSAAAKGSMTVTDWSRLSDDVRGEFVDGRLVEEELPSNLHEVVVGWLLWRLSAWAFPRGAYVVGADHKVAIGPRRGRKPDASVYLPGRRLDPQAALATVPPDLVVEVISPRPRDTKRDRVEKPDDYARAGVRLYLLVDPAMRTVELFELGADGRYARAASAADGKLRVAPLRGLSLDLDALWCVVARLGE